MIARVEARKLSPEGRHLEPAARWAFPFACGWPAPLRQFGWVRRPSAISPGHPVSRCRPSPARRPARAVCTFGPAALVGLPRGQPRRTSRRLPGESVWPQARSSPSRSCVPTQGRKGWGNCSLPRFFANRGLRNALDPHGLAAAGVHSGGRGLPLLSPALTVPIDSVHSSSIRPSASSSTRPSRRIFPPRSTYRLNPELEAILDAHAVHREEEERSARPDRQCIEVHGGTPRV